jgi:hypothetical protein
MGWLAFLRFSLICLLVYCGVPGAIRGRRPGKRWGLALVETFLLVACIQQFGVMLLGAARLALPGAMFLLYAATLGAFGVERWRRSSKQWTAAEQVCDLIVSRPELAKEPLRRIARCVPMLIPNAAIVCSVLVAAGWFAVHNARLPELESYSRSLSLGRLANGDIWSLDATVPLLLTPAMFSALPAFAAIAASVGLTAALMAAAAGFVSFELFQSRLCSVLATGAAGFGVVLMRHNDSTAAMAAVLLLFSTGLAARSRFIALAGLIAGASISMSTSVWQLVATAAGSVLLAGTLALAVSRWSIPVRRFSMWVASVFFVVWLGALTERESKAPATMQYEAAARACQTIASTYSRNSWLIVSPAQELACTYGSGWHVELQTFVRQHTPAQAADPVFRFDYPVADLFFFIEKKPLRPGAGGRLQADSADQGLAPIEHASLEYEAANILAAYASTHADLKQIYEDDSMTIYHANGPLGGARSDPWTDNN